MKMIVSEVIKMISFDLLAISAFREFRMDRSRVE